MKRFMIIPMIAAISFASCNNEGSQTTTTIDSTPDNGADIRGAGTSTTDTVNSAGSTDEASSDFLKKAAEGGMVEVEAGKTAREKGLDGSVKNFADMMVNDHTGANGEVKNLASKKNVTLPTDLPAEKKESAGKLSQKTGKDFDKAYMDMMVKDHKATIDLFEKAQKDSKDDEVRSFITTTLPKLKTHLDSAQAISKRLK
ncbi:MAG: DUF4142 domain-containing protein [Chitinophagaceae bacterium]|nr:MAG: DUF4142 domain-containing protein [Chitinophagaceae bacterium]